MLFFKRILNAATGQSASREKRRMNRYAINAAFPLRAVLCLSGRDSFGNPLKTSEDKGWDWKGQLVNFSRTGVQMVLPPAALAARGDDCQLTLSLDRYQLVIPCRVAHLKEHRDHTVFGLELNLTESETRQAYRQLVDLVALGASLKLAKSGNTEDSGYLFEQYGKADEALLTVWRDATQQMVTAFELKVRDYYIRGTSKNRKLKYFTRAAENKITPVAASQHVEMQRLYRWMLPNISDAVPADVLDFMKQRD